MLCLPLDSLSIFLLFRVLLGFFLLDWCKKRSFVVLLTYPFQCVAKVDFLVMLLN